MTTLVEVDVERSARAAVLACVELIPTPHRVHHGIWEAPVISHLRRPRPLVVLHFHADRIREPATAICTFFSRDDRINVCNCTLVADGDHGGSWTFRCTFGEDGSVNPVPYGEVRWSETDGQK